MQYLIVTLGIFCIVGCSRSGDTSDSARSLIETTPEIEKRRFQRLTRVDISNFASVTDVAVSNDSSCSTDPVQPHDFELMIKDATLVNPGDSLLTEWHYAPWCQVDFRAGTSNWNASLYLGGLAFVTNDEGTTSALLLDVKRLER